VFFYQGGDIELYKERIYLVMKISVVIPTYEANDRGVEFVQQGITSIREQKNFSDYEIVITDHSRDDKIKSYVDSIRADNIIYIKNNDGRGSSSANMNNGVKHATGEIIKPLFMDDYLYSNEALFLIHEMFVEGAKWAVAGNNSTYDRKTYFNEFIPMWNRDIILGKNTLSSPSCMAYLKCDVRWDERLIWLMDCKFYHDLYIKFGEPAINRKILVTNYGHKGQLTHTMGEKRKRWEEELIKSEYSHGGN